MWRYAGVASYARWAARDVERAAVVADHAADHAAVNAADRAAEGGAAVSALGERERRGAGGPVAISCRGRRHRTCLWRINGSGGQLL